MGVLSSQKPTAAAPETSKATAWRRASTALAALALVAVIGPVAASVLLDTKDEHAQRQDQKKEAAAKEAEEEEDAEEERSTGRGVMGFFGGGGSAGGGSRSGSSSDVMACNRAANSARKNANPPQHQGLAKALDKAGGGLLGATANSLYGVERQAADDVRAADAFKACMDASR